MRIAQLAPVVESVPPQLYGGTERVIAALIAELTALGHDVTLYASGDSHTPARLLPQVEKALWKLDEPCSADVMHTVELSRVLRDAPDYDIIHSHLDFFAFPYGRVSTTPFIHTLHGRLDAPELQALYREFPETPVISISDSQRRPLPWANWVATVYNGIQTQNLPLGPGKGGYLAFLGRISPEKGVDQAIDVALKTGIPLKIAARMPLENLDNAWVRADWAYYREQVKPRLSHPLIEFVGEVDDHGKYDLLKDAMALVFPINWPEPFGLVMAEALACGTPVIARRIASTPEIIQHGRTGFLCDTIDEMVEACRQVHTIDRIECRRDVEERFSARTMARHYLGAYRAVLATAEERRHQNLRVARPGDDLLTAQLGRRATTLTRGLSHPNAEPASVP
ncbi:MAG: glycosyltransferase family 4 protein [Chloroflexi bacterium]|nr:glycosyltransferase family 4 protein [Chloroflexota bacterium]